MRLEYFPPVTGPDVADGERLFAQRIGGVKPFHEPGSESPDGQ